MKIIFTLYGKNQFTDKSVNSVDDIPRRCFWQTFISIYLVTYTNRNFVDDAACVFMCKKKKHRAGGREQWRERLKTAAQIPVQILGSLK